MHVLETLLREKIATGLQHTAIHTCTQWAQRYRIMGNPFPGIWSPQYHPWAPTIQDDESDFIVVKKGAQLGFTEIALNKVFYAIDILGKSVLYVLPANTPDASDFSTSRFDAALEMSPYLARMFSDVSNIGHKRAGNCNLYIRGSRSRSQLKSIPVGLVILDEVDEMIQDNIPLTYERLAGQLDRQIYALSTPTVEGYGIDALYNDSTQNHFFFRCPSCNKLIELLYPESLQTDPPNLICSLCKTILPHETKTSWLSTGRWVPTCTSKAKTGYYLNQLYSPAESPQKIVEALERARLNPIDEQEYYNSKLGLTHTVSGAKISDIDIDSCIQDYVMSDSAIGLITIGVDVGKWLHYEIDKWTIETNPTSDINLVAVPRLISMGKCLEFSELVALVQRFNVVFGVIDAEPEYRSALDLAQKFYGRFKLCFYGHEISGKHIQINNEEEHTIRVKRTAWMDMALSRFRKQRIVLPRDITPEYRLHIKEPTRIYERDSDGNMVARYIRVKEDHLAHARTYSEIALKLAVSLGTSQDITHAR